VVRETLEETGWHFRPEALTGVYRWRKPGAGATFVRVCFTGRCEDHDPTRTLDEGIVRTVWMSRGEIAAATERLRSPLVLACVDDYLAQRRYPLELLVDL
jgi:ADP-ribose pyrophosphatase YjhB (NUDIX family)